MYSPMDVDRRLSDLPSELLSIIVSHLAPSYEDRFKPGQKKDLQNANLAHRCLRQWVPQFLFRDMCLMVIADDLSFKLEGMLLDPLGLELVKHVRNVQLKVPPAIRWEIDFDENARTLSNSRTLRLLSRFGVTNEKSLTLQQQAFCRSYHYAMIGTFTKNSIWNLRTVGPSDPTTTNAFIKRWGRDVITHESPAYVEDPATNLTWASGVVTQTIPGKVKSLHLSAANLNDLSRSSTENLLLARTYGRHDTSHNPARNLLSVTNLTIDIRGVQGTHGRLDWDATQTAERQISNIITEDEILTNLTGCTLSWLLPEVHRPLQSLSLCNFRMDAETLPKCLLNFKSSLKSLLLDEIQLSGHDEGDDDSPWLTLATWLKEHMQGMKIRIDRPYKTWDNCNPMDLYGPVSQPCLKNLSGLGM